MDRAQPGKLILNIFQAKDLLAGDSNGLSDPFYHLYYYGQ